MRIASEGPTPPNFSLGRKWSGAGGSVAQNGSISSSSIKGEAISMSMDISSKNLTIAQIGAIQGPQICQSPRSTGGNAARKRTGSSTHGARSSSCIEPSETAQRPKGRYHLSTPDLSVCRSCPSRRSPLAPLVLPDCSRSYSRKTI